MTQLFVVPMTLVFLVLSPAACALGVLRGIVRDEPVVANPTELGTVKWERSFEAAAARAKSSGKPIFILFSEVPGCATCKNFGERVMSHSLIVEAIESLFVPLAVYSNVEGADRATLESFGEPTWNNPVVRIVSADRTMLTPRVDGDYTAEGVVRAMIKSLESAKREVPTYLRTLNEECRAMNGKSSQAVFAVHCFWEGEERIGTVPGVVKSRIGFLDGHEVVEVEYVPSVLSFKSLRERLASMSCATRIYARDAEQASSKPSGANDSLSVKRSDEAVRLDAVQKHHLSHTTFKHVPMTELQASRLNASIARRAQHHDVLSPRQIDAHAAVEAHPNAAWPVLIGVDLAKAWEQFESVRRGLATSGTSKERSKLPDSDASNVAKPAEK